MKCFTKSKAIQIQEEKEKKYKKKDRKEKKIYREVASDLYSSYKCIYTLSSISIVLSLLPSLHILSFLIP